MKPIVKVKDPSMRLERLIIRMNDFSGDRDPKHRAEEIIRICDVTGNKKLTKEEVSSNEIDNDQILNLFFFFLLK